MRRRKSKRDVRLLADTTAPRVCLSCDCPFTSEGPWNRICTRCGSKHAANDMHKAPQARCRDGADAPWATDRLRELQHHDTIHESGYSSRNKGDGEF